MPTVIDSLVVTLGLDASKYKTGQQEAVGSLKRTKDEANRTAKDMEASGKQAAAFFAQIKNEALGLIGVLLGAKGLESLVAGTTNSLADLGREARNIGVSGRELKAFSNVIEQNGGSASSARQSLFGLAQQIERFKTLGDPAILRFLSPIGASIDDTPIGIFQKFVSFAQQHQNDPGLVNLIGKGLGFDQGTINAAEQMKSLTEYQKEYNQALKDAPTQQQIDDATELQRQWLALKQAGESLSQTIVGKLDRTMIDLTKHTHDWIETNKESIADNVTGKIEHLADVMKVVSDSLGTWKSTGELVAAYFAGPFAIAVMAGLGPVAAAIAAIVAALALIDKTRNSDMASLSPNSPLWEGVSQQEQSNYVNSPRSQAFLHPGNPNPFSIFNPGSWRGRKSSAFESAQRQTSQDAITRFFLAQGYTSEQVSGILANAESESGFDPSADNGSHYGIFQWDSARQADFARLFGHDIHQSSLQEQMQFAQWELTHTEARAGAALHSAKSKYSSGSVFSQDFERAPGGVLTAEQRGLLAEQYAPSPGVAPLPSSTGGATDVHINQITINTQATDARGIARDIHGAIATQANRGLQ